MSISHTRDMDPRIRILSCEAEAPPPRRRDWRLPVAAVVVAVFGVGITLAVTAPRQPSTLASEPAPAPVVRAVDVELMGSAGARAVRPTRDIHRAIRTAVTADFRAAAQLAKPTEGTGFGSPPASTTASTASAASETSSASSQSQSAGQGTVSRPTTQVPSAAVDRSPAQEPSASVNQPPQQAASGTVTQPSQPKSGAGSVGPENAPGAGNPVDPAQ